MSWFHLNFRKVAALLMAFSLPLLSLNLEQRPAKSAWFDQPFHWLAGGIQQGFFLFSDGVRGTTSEYLNLLSIKGENRRLTDEINGLRARHQLFEELQRENARLSELLDFRARSRMQLVAARVISRDLLTDHSTIRINKGRHHGLQEGQAVISVDGAVGYVFRPEAFSSLVLLVTDRYSVVDGIVVRSRARGIVEGKSSGSCTLRYVEKAEDVKPGDLVVTSGLDNIFPKGFPVAVVESVESSSFAVSFKVALRPVIESSKIEEVFVILNAANEDFSDRLNISATETNASSGNRAE